MTRIALLPAVFALAACGGTSRSTPTGDRGGGGPGPAMVFVGLNDQMMFEAACHDCDVLRAGLDGQLVTSGAATFKVTGSVSDQCDASGPSQVTGVTLVSGDPEAASLGLVVVPADAAIGLQRYDVIEPVPPLAPDLVATLLRLADQDQNPTPAVTADELVIEQVLTLNVAGRPTPDRLIAVHTRSDQGDSPGFRWSALVLVPDGDLAAARSLWHSDLERMIIEASFDLEGDGVREFTFDAEYYEGEGKGGARVTNGKLELLGTWGCGA